MSGLTSACLGAGAVVDSEAAETSITCSGADGTEQRMLARDTVGFRDLDESWAALLARLCALQTTFLTFKGRLPLTTRARLLREASRAETRASAFFEDADGGRFSAFEDFLIRKRLPRGWTKVTMSRVVMKNE